MCCPPLTVYAQCLCQVQLWITPVTSHKHMTYRLTHTDFNYFYRKLNELANHTLWISLANRYDNDDSFMTSDEISVICWAVTCQVITINKAVRHYDHDPITLLLNHCMGVKGAAGDEKWTYSTPKTIKSGRMRTKSKVSVIWMCVCVKTIHLPLTSGPCLSGNLGTMNIWTKVCTNPSCRCWDISVKVVDQPTNQPINQQTNRPNSRPILPSLEPCCSIYSHIDKSNEKSDDLKMSKDTSIFFNSIK